LFCPEYLFVLGDPRSVSSSVVLFAMLDLSFFRLLKSSITVRAQGSFFALEDLFRCLVAVRRWPRVLSFVFGLPTLRAVKHRNRVRICLCRRLYHYLTSRYLPVAIHIICSGSPQCSSKSFSTSGCPSQSHTCRTLCTPLYHFYSAIFLVLSRRYSMLWHTVYNDGLGSY
jgi:hypothetical protein